MIEVTDYEKKASGWAGHRFKVGDYVIDTEVIPGHWSPEGEEIFITYPDGERKLVFSNKTGSDVDRTITKRADEINHESGLELKICRAQAEWELVKSFLEL